MGAYKYLEELWRKKQSDVCRFIMRVRTWEFRQLPVIHKCNRPSRPEKARRLGFKAKRTHKSVAEERVARKCSNLRTLNSYWVGQDASFKFYEIVMVDPSHKAIRRDPRINWICASTMKHRELRGVTATGKKARGMNQKGHKAMKKRPSRRSDWKNRNTQKFWRYRKH